MRKYRVVTARVRFPFVKTYRDATGVIRHYFRKKGHPSVALPSEFGSQEFIAAYQKLLPTDAPKPERLGFVYVCKLADHVKIGFSTDVESRIASLQTSAPTPIHLLITFPSTQVIERELHKRFAAQRTKGEWFRHEGEIKAWIEGGCQ